MMNVPKTHTHNLVKPQRHLENPGRRGRVREGETGCLAECCGDQCRPEAQTTMSGKARAFRKVHNVVVSNRGFGKKSQKFH